MSAPAFHAPSTRPGSEGNDLVLLGLRLLIAADLVRLGLRRWTAFDLSARTLEIEGFPSPEGWLITALLAGGIGVVTLLTGWQERWGAALALLFFMPVATIFSVSYTPTDWPSWIGAMLPLAAMTENLLLGLGLLGLFLYGAGQYTLSRGLCALGRTLPSLKQPPSLDGVSTSPKKQAAQQ